MVVTMETMVRSGDDLQFKVVLIASQIQILLTIIDHCRRGLDVSVWSSSQVTQNKLLRQVNMVRPDSGNIETEFMYADLRARYTPELHKTL